jgi:putative iron-regulated protein
MKHKPLVTVILASSLLGACSSSDNNPNNNPDDSSNPIINIVNVKKVLNTNADIALAVYSDALDTAKTLKTALAALRENPSAETLSAAKSAWLVAREPYGQSEVYRFRKSPIDSTDYSSEDGPEGDINAWPLGEALIDYVVSGGDFGDEQIGVTAHNTSVNGNAAIDTSNHSGNNIIATSAIVIDADLLANNTTADDEHDVIAGYHAIEFLLWGQDLNNEAAITDGSDRDQAIKAKGAVDQSGSSLIATGGQRPLSDFISAESNDSADRRHQYLAVAVDKLISDLESVRDGWTANARYRQAFTSISTEGEAKQKLAEILTGMGTLSKGELAGERMQIAYRNNSQEDEHSCFSDNTHRDIWLNAQGVSNSYYGDYAGYDHDLDPDTADSSTRSVNGYGIDDYLNDSGISSLQTLKTALETALSETENYYTEIDTSARQGKPVDVLIMSAHKDSNNPIRKTIISLDAQATIISNIAEALELGEVVDEGASECNTSDPDSDNC